MPTRPSGSLVSARPRAASKLSKYASVVSTRWPTTSRTCQCPAPVGASHASGGVARANICSASRRTTRKRLSLLCGSMKFHSLIAGSFAPRGLGRLRDGAWSLRRFGDEHVSFEDADAFAVKLDAGAVGVANVE